MEPELTSEIAKISITDPLIKDKKFSKHVLYNITGTDNKGSFQIQRRYKEFNALRISLLHQWPGCYVPMIPPKKMIVKNI